MPNGDTLTAIILSVFSSGVLAACIGYFKDRHKDKATAKLTDVQTLQAQLTYVEGVAEYLRKHNDDLQEDYGKLEEKYRKQRERITQLEEEIMRVRQSAAQTQIECERLGHRLQALMGEDHP